MASSDVNQTTFLLDKSTGKAREKEGLSLGSFLASLTLAVLFFLAQLILFFLLRIRLRNTNKGQSSRTSTTRIPRLRLQPSNLKASINTLVQNSTQDLRRSSIDGYFFLRYLVVLLKIFGLLSCTVTPVLIPLNVRDGKNKQSSIHGMDRLGWANVSLSHPHRYWAHLICATFVAAYIGYMTWRELQQYIRIRQAYLTRHPARSRISTRTVLISSVPKEWLLNGELHAVCDSFPGGVRRVCINRDYKSLARRVNQRAKVASALEQAETREIIAKVRAHTSKECNGYGANYLLGFRGKFKEQPQTGQQDRLRGSIAQILPCFKTRTWTIRELQKEYDALTREIENLQQKPESFPVLSSAFVQFNDPASAQTVSQVLVHLDAWTMTPRQTQIVLEDVIWENVGINWWGNLVRGVLLRLALGSFTLACVVPFTFIGLLSQVVYLTASVGWLHWLQKAPTWVLATIQGVLPPTLLTGLLLIFSSSARYLVRQRGLHFGVAVELSVQNCYFTFLFVNVILVVTLAAGLTSLYKNISENVSFIAAALTNNLPKASNYFYSYILLQALSTSATTLLQTGQLAKRLLVSPLLDRTVSQKIARQVNITDMQWGTLYPLYTNIACIGIIYSVISPLILIIITIAIALVWVAHCYSFSCTSEYTVDAGGLNYPTAIQQLLTGVYAMEASLISLFFLARGPDNEMICIGQGVVMTTVLIGTMLFHHALRKAFQPFLHHLPVRYESYKQGSARKEQAEPSTESDDDEIAFQHPALSAKRPIIRIPADEVGYSRESILRARAQSALIPVSDKEASVDMNGRITITESFLNG